MPDNIEYAYMGYAATVLIMGGLVAWIAWRWRSLVSEARQVDALEAELQAEQARSRAASPAAAAPPAAEAAPAPAGTPLAEET